MTTISGNTCRSNNQVAKRFVALTIREPVASRVAEFEETYGKVPRTLALRERGGLVLLYNAPWDSEACRGEVGDGLTVEIRHLDLFLERKNLTQFPNRGDAARGSRVSSCIP